MIDHNSSWENVLLNSSAILYVSSSGNAWESYWTCQMKACAVVAKIKSSCACARWLIACTVVCCRCRTITHSANEARAPSHEGLETDIWCCRCQSPSMCVSDNIKSQSSCARATLAYMNSLWPCKQLAYEAYDSLCTRAWCLRQMWHECNTWHIASCWMSFVCLSLCCYAFSWVEGQQEKLSKVGPSAQPTVVLSTSRSSS
jgi:hypothetical protein